MRQNFLAASRSPVAERLISFPPKLPNSRHALHRRQARLDRVGRSQVVVNPRLRLFQRAYFAGWPNSVRANRVPRLPQCAETGLQVSCDISPSRAPKIANGTACRITGFMIQASCPANYLSDNNT